MHQSKRIVVDPKMVSTLKSNGSTSDAKYYSVDANVKVGKKNNEHQPKQPRQKDSRADGKSRKASNFKVVVQRPTSQLCEEIKEERKTFNPQTSCRLGKQTLKMNFKVLSHVTSMDEKNFIKHNKDTQNKSLNSFIPDAKIVNKPKEDKIQNVHLIQISTNKNQKSKRKLSSNDSSFKKSKNSHIIKPIANQKKYRSGKVSPHILKKSVDLVDDNNCCSSQKKKLKNLKNIKMPNKENQFSLFALKVGFKKCFRNSSGTTEASQEICSRIFNIKETSNILNSRKQHRRYRVDRNNKTNCNQTNDYEISEKCLRNIIGKLIDLNMNQREGAVK